MDTKENKLFVRVCETISDYGKYVPKNENILNSVKTDKDYYASIYYYNPEQVEKARELVEIGNKKRPRGIGGITDVFTDKLVWDFDSDNLVDSQRDTISLVLRLKALGLQEEQIQICFSGAKGFHVEVQTDQKFTPPEFTEITKDLAKNLKTRDSRIVNPARFLRVIGTKHPKSGLYKIPLFFEELRDLSPEKIKQAAKNKPKKDDEVMATWVKATHIFTVPERPVEKPKKEAKSDSNVNYRVDYSRNPYRLIPWKLALSQGIFPAGTRNDALMILGATLKAKGLDQDDCYYALKSASQKQAKLFGQDKYDKGEIWKNIINPIYSALWNGATYSTANFPEKLRNFFIESGIPEITEAGAGGTLVGIDDIFAKFSRYAENMEENTKNRYHRTG